MSVWHFLLARRAPYTAIVGWFLASRLLLFVVGGSALQVFAAAFGGDPDDLGALFCRWDCGWYLNIIADGYSTAARGTGETNFAFFPVFPAITWALHQASGMGAVTSGAILSNLVFLGALFLVFEYALRVALSQRAALLAVALLCFVPESFVFSAVYSESTFLLLLAAAMLLQRSARPLASGLCAAVLSATRPTGIMFLVFAVARLIRTSGVRRFAAAVWDEPARLAPIFLAPVGLIAFWWWCYFLSGDAFAQATTSRHGWGWQATWPWLALWNNLVHGAFPEAFRAAASLAAFAASLLLLRLRLYEEWLFCAATFLLVWSNVKGNGLVRYSIVLFPIYIGLASLLEDRRALTILVFCAFGLVGGFLMVAWAAARNIVI